MIAVGCDIDGTITADPDAYREILSALVSAGHEVHVITAGDPSRPDWHMSPADRVEQLLRYDLVQGRDYTMLHVADGDDKEEMGAAKRDICEQFGVVFMFENDETFAAEISQVAQCVLMVPRGDQAG